MRETLEVTNGFAIIVRWDVCKNRCARMVASWETPRKKNSLAELRKYEDWCSERRLVIAERNGRNKLNFHNREINVIYNCLMMTENEGYEK